MEKKVIGRQLASNEHQTPACISIQINTTAILFPCEITITVESQGGPKTSYVQRIIVLILVERSLSECKERSSPVFVHVIYVGLKFICLIEQGAHISHNNRGKQTEFLLFESGLHSTFLFPSSSFLLFAMKRFLLLVRSISSGNVAVLRVCWQ